MKCTSAFLGCPVSATMETGRYRSQFIKLLRCMYEDFLPELGKKAATDPDIQPLRTLLEHYLTARLFEKEPEGRAMPKVDISSLFERC